VPQEGLYYLNRDQVAPDSILDRITAAIKDKPLEDRVVYIKSGSTVTYGTVVSLIDAVRSAGCDRIGLVSQKSDRGNRPRID
jgi:biopolymer transport protein ExbD/biopolymer transport protein TolR